MLDQYGRPFSRKKSMKAGTKQIAGASRRSPPSALPPRRPLAESRGTIGAWAHGDPASFSDDSRDIRGEYRELLEDQVPDAEATEKVIEAYRDLGSDEAHVLWIALAAAQSQVGRLDADVKARALDVIDNSRGLELREEAGPEELGSRLLHSASGGSRDAINDAPSSR